MKMQSVLYTHIFKMSLLDSVTIISCQVILQFLYLNKLYDGRWYFFQDQPLNNLDAQYIFLKIKQ